MSLHYANLGGCFWFLNPNKGDHQCWALDQATVSEHHLQEEWGMTGHHLPQNQVELGSQH